MRPALAALLAALVAPLAAAPALAQCATSAVAWRNASLAAQTGSFTVGFTAIPRAARIDGVTGLAQGAASGYSSLAAVVRLNNAGYFDARNGSVYAADAQIPYVSGAAYWVRMTVDVAAKRYSVWITPPGAAERALAVNYAFRTEQAGVSRLDDWALESDSGSHDVCGLIVQGAAAPAPAPAPAPSGCLAGTSAWKSDSFTSMTGPFTATFDATPGAAKMDGVVGLSKGAPTAYSSLAVSLRFNNAGYLDARNGSAYAAATAIPYAAGQTFRFRVVVDLAGKRYSAWATPPSGAELPLATSYAFRTEQASVTSLDSWGLYASAGSHQACSFAAAPSAAPPPDATAPAVALTSPAAGATVAGSISIAATASDASGIAGVQFFADGASLGAEVTKAPFALAWNTATASNGSHTLTATARDAAGNRASASATVTVNNPPAGGSGHDRFGVRMIYPTAPGGKEWTSNWDNGVARTFGSGQTDPKDPWFHGKGNATYAPDGKGDFYISGSVPRMYVLDPAQTSWRNVEMTVYAYRVSDSGTSYGGIEGVARTNHSGYGGSETQNPCDSRGNDARFRYDGHIDFEKETKHPYSSTANNKAMWSTLPYKAWIGYKLVVYDLPNGDVKLESWMDLTDGANGGDWRKVNELEDNGANFAVGGTACKTGIDPAIKLTNSDARPGTETGRPNFSAYWRSDNVGANGLVYKRMSIREIAAP